MRPFWRHEYFCWGLSGKVDFKDIRRRISDWRFETNKWKRETLHEREFNRWTTACASSASTIAALARTDITTVGVSENELLGRDPRHVERVEVRLSSMAGPSGLSDSFAEIPAADVCIGSEAASENLALSDEFEEAENDQL